MDNYNDFIFIYKFCSLKERTNNTHTHTHTKWAAFKLILNVCKLTSFRKYHIQTYTHVKQMDDSIFYSGLCYYYYYFDRGRGDYL